MKGISQFVVRVAVGVAACAALAASATAYAQDKPSKADDPETQTAVADYNAGNLSAALVEFRKAALRGNRLAEFNYAMMLLNGEGTTANVDEGKKWLRKAADANMSHAQYVYGKMYDDGEFVGRDPVEAHVPIPTPMFPPPDRIKVAFFGLRMPMDRGVPLRHV